MSRADWTDEAEDDLTEIAYYITVKEGRPETARKNLVEIRDKAEQYARNPE